MAWNFFLPISLRYVFPNIHVLFISTDWCKHLHCRAVENYERLEVISLFRNESRVKQTRDDREYALHAWKMSPYRAAQCDNDVNLIQTKAICTVTRNWVCKRRRKLFFVKLFITMLHAWTKRCAIIVIRYDIIKESTQFICLLWVMVYRQQ